jgi:hypothetical protein
MSLPNDRLSHESQHRSPMNVDRNPGQMSPQILEHGDIFFFYRPKVRATEVKGIEDIRRFFMVTATDSRQPHSEIEAKTETKTKEEIQGLTSEKKAGNQSSSSSPTSTSTWYRLFTIGKKSLPEVRHTEARMSERYWAKVGGIFYDAKDLRKELLAPEYRGRFCPSCW